VPVLLGLGFTALSPGPVMLALVQEHLPQHRAVANGLYMSMGFLIQSVTILAIGAVGDAFGLRTAFLWSALASLLAVLPVLWLPRLAEIPGES
jgi:FSR family fosmidomycin resistance protein-like MFS transporter